MCLTVTNPAQKWWFCDTLRHHDRCCRSWEINAGRLCVISRYFAYKNIPVAVTKKQSPMQDLLSSSKSAQSSGNNDIKLNAGMSIFPDENTSATTYYREVHHYWHYLRTLLATQHLQSCCTFPAILWPIPELLAELLRSVSTPLNNSGVPSWHSAKISNRRCQVWQLRLGIKTKLGAHRPCTWLRDSLSQKGSQLHSTSLLSQEMQVMSRRFHCWLHILIIILMHVCRWFLP